MTAQHSRLRLVALWVISGLVLLATAPWLTGVSHAAGRTYYVAPGGNDSSSGTDPGQPFKTVQHAVDLAQPGDTITLGTGVYAQDVISKRDGQPSAAISIKGPADAVIQGGGNGRVIEINHDYITLDGFTINGLYGNPNSPDGYRDKLLYVLGKQPRDGVRGLKVLHMTLKNGGGECIRLRYFAQQNEIANSTIQTCGVHDFRFNDGGKNGEGVYIGTAPEQRGDGKNPNSEPDLSNGNWIHDNTFNTQGNECVDIKEAASGNVVENNRCTGQRDPESGGFDSRGNRNVFRNNEVYGNVGVGVRLGGDSAGDGIDNNIYNNAMHDNQAGGIRFQRAPQGSICGNRMSGNRGGDAVGNYGGQFHPTTTCDGAAATAVPTAPAAPAATPVSSTPVAPTATPAPTSVPANPAPTAPSNPTACGAYTVDGQAVTFIEAERYASSAGSFQALDDNNRSGGKAMTVVRSDAKAKASADTRLSYALDIVNGGTFQIWLLGSGQDGSSDSFYLSVDGAKPVQAVVTQGEWGWKKAGGSFKLGDGPHTLQLLDRENNARVDKLLLTRDRHAKPSGLGGDASAPQCS